MSGSTEKLTKSAEAPAATLRDWSPDAPYDCWNCTPLPAAVALNAGMSLS